MDVGLQGELVGWIPHRHERNCVCRRVCRHWSELPMTYAGEEIRVMAAPPCHSDEFGMA
jgi:hypothetical protein